MCSLVHTYYVGIQLGLICIQQSHDYSDLEEGHYSEFTLMSVSCIITNSNRKRKGESESMENLKLGLGLIYYIVGNH